jgi:hypothetical protein
VLGAEPLRDQCAGAENSRLLLMVEGRDIQVLGAFAEGAAPAWRPSLPEIEAIAMDMSTSYI